MAAAPTQFSIIGTAGRKVPLGHKLTRELFDKMVVAVEAQIRAINPNLHTVELVSGGAAWVDHVAVVLYLTGRYKALTLYMPAPFDFKTSTYVDTGDVKGRKSTGWISNFYFQRFSKIMEQRNMGDDITRAFKQGAHLDIGDNFFERNTHVAKSQVVIALTWANGDAPDDGGTKNTWSKIKSTSRKIHIGLKTLVV